MEEELLKLNVKVRHKPTRIEGRVTSVHQTANGTQYCVEYVDDSGKINDHWAPHSELEPIDTASA